MKFQSQLILSLLLVICQAEITKPSFNDTLNYIHVVFEWEQMADFSEYNLLIYEENDSNPFLYIVDSTLTHILIDGLGWGIQYTAEICDHSLENCTNSVEFYILPLPENIQNLGDIEVIINDTIQYSPGITLLDFSGSSNAFAIDMNGKPVWYIDNQISWFDNEPRGIVITELLPNGNILGLTRSTEVSGHAYEMDVNNQVVWDGPGNLEGIGVHHDSIHLPNGNVMVLVSQDILLQVPEFEWPIEVPDSIIWRGDKIVEWDHDGNEIWSWSVFDHFSLEDWDYAIFLQAFGLGFYDWTHSNAIWYDQQENAVYLSVRHLSRITKIDYNTGEIVWNMGKDTPSGEVTFGYELDFSWQHSIRMLENRNLLLFDNGNENDPPLSRGLEILLMFNDSIPSAEIIWEYVLPEDLGSSFQSDCDRLPNGNSLITSTNSEYLVEVSSDGLIVWEVQPGQGISTYRAERVPGLYPLLFSVIQPEFMEVNGYPVLFLPVGETTLSYSINNEGWRDQDFTYTIADVQGWFSEDGTVEINPLEYADLNFTTEIPELINDNLVTFTVIPESAFDLQKTTEFHLHIYLPESGDVNLDGYVDVLDILVVVAIILETTELQPYHYEIVDLNNDESIDIFDIVLMINIILGT